MSSARYNLSEMPDYTSKNALDFYSTQSVFSDPKENKYLFENLPDSIEELCEIIRGVIVHQDDTKKIYNFDIPEHRQLESNTRYVSKILQRIVELQGDKLTVVCKPEKRFIGVCRDFAIILCSILRYKNIPARLRCGFATYYERSWYVDHWLCEYWNARQNRWILVDTEVNDAVRKTYDIEPSFNSFDVSYKQYILSGKAWLMCRSGKANPKKFGVPSINIAGLWFVRGNLLRDFTALNKVELLPWDYTKFSDKQFNNISELPEKEIRLVDRLAEAVINVYDDWGKVRELYKNNSQLQVQKKVTSYTTLGPKEIELKLS